VALPRLTACLSAALVKLDQAQRLDQVPYYGALAQLGEHLLCKQGVIGSIPIGSTTFAVLRLRMVGELTAGKAIGALGANKISSRDEDTVSGCNGR
jgi:hypothetical protein